MLSLPLEGSGGQGSPPVWPEREGGDPQGSDLTWKGEREKTQWGGTCSKPLKERLTPLSQPPWGSPTPVPLHSGDWGGYTMSKSGGRGLRVPSPGLLRTLVSGAHPRAQKLAQEGLHV